MSLNETKTQEQTEKTNWFTDWSAEKVLLIFLIVVAASFGGCYFSQQRQDKKARKHDVVSDLNKNTKNAKTVDFKKAMKAYTMLYPMKQR